MNMYNCPLRDEQCIRKRCFFWVNANCVILNINTQLDEVTERLDRIEKKMTIEKEKDD